jgi:alpha-L-fucosidase
VRELLANYGDAAVIWWDTPTRMTDAFAEKLNAELAKYPQVITNDRLKRPNFPGDYKTPEQKIPDPSQLGNFDWETCMTINGSWGYKSWDNNWKSAETLIRNLINIASKGGNYLLNVGPTPEGEIPQQSIDRLHAIGRWMKTNGEAIYQTQRSPVAKPDWGYITRRDNPAGATTLYLAVCEPTADRTITLQGIVDARSAVLLDGKTKLKIEKGAGGLRLRLPAILPDPIASVIKLELNGTLAPSKGGAGASQTFDIVDEK